MQVYFTLILSHNSLSLSPMLLLFSVFIIKNLIDEVEYLDRKAEQGLGNEGCISIDSDITNCNTFRHAYKKKSLLLTKAPFI